jgi:hypothetical protein
VCGVCVREVYAWTRPYWLGSFVYKSLSCDLTFVLFSLSRRCVRTSDPMVTRLASLLCHSFCYSLMCLCWLAVHICTVEVGGLMVHGWRSIPLARREERTIMPRFFHVGVCDV